MMMQMLAAGGLHPLVDHARAADEDNARGYFEYEPVKRTREDASWVEAAVGKVVKMVYLLLYDLPSDYRYRVVLMERPLVEVLASQRAMLARRGEPGADLPAERLAEAFVRQREKVEHWLGQQPNFQVLKVSYDNVLASPPQQVGRLVEFLDARLDHSAMVAAVEPALRRQKG